MLGREGRGRAPEQGAHRGSRPKRGAPAGREAQGEREGCRPVLRCGGFHLVHGIGCEHARPERIDGWFAEAPRWLSVAPVQPIDVERPVPALDRPDPRCEVGQERATAPMHRLTARRGPRSAGPGNRRGGRLDKGVTVRAVRHATTQTRTTSRASAGVGAIPKVQCRGIWSLGHGALAVCLFYLCSNLRARQRQSKKEHLQHIEFC